MGDPVVVARPRESRDLGDSVSVEDAAGTRLAGQSRMRRELLIIRDDSHMQSTDPRDTGHHLFAGVGEHLAEQLILVMLVGKKINEIGNQILPGMHLIRGNVEVSSIFGQVFGDSLRVVLVPGIEIAPDWFGAETTAGLTVLAGS